MYQASAPRGLLVNIVAPEAALHCGVNPVSESVVRDRRVLIRLAALLCAVSIALGTRAACAQFGELEAGGPKRDKESTTHYDIGVLIKAGPEPCSGMFATVPVPIDWPEQEVKILEEPSDTYAKRVTFRDVGGGAVKQMIINVPFIPPNEQSRVVVTLEISRYTLVPPDDTAALVIPAKKIEKSVRQYLQTSPKIEVNNPKIKALAKEIVADKEGAWEKVEAIYDWVREHVKYVNGPLKGAVAALNDGTGDCEELTSLFIALCRNIGVPARTVWVPGHCYPEFYLQNAEGKGYWFPCQAAGARAFGGIPEQRPILQKGDSFSVPERREKQRYVAEFLRGDGGQPTVQWIRELAAPRG